MSAIPASRLARAIVRQLRLSRGSRILHVGCGHGEVVRQLRRRRMHAFGVYDGPSPADPADGEPPELQTATLHQSLPFSAHWFDAIFVQQTLDYTGLLSTPQACTATANLLAALKPHGALVVCQQPCQEAMKQHLVQFPGQGSHLMLGAAGLAYWTLRACGLSRPGLPGLRFTIPHEPISRLEWHRLARKAVATLSSSTSSAADRTADAPAA